MRSSGDTAIYEKNFGFKFVAVDTPAFSSSYDWYDRAIISDEFYGLPDVLSGKRVAIIGNGMVTGCGPEIDSHDVVIRITSMRHWQKSAVHDGTRLSIWAGVPSFVVRYNEKGKLESDRHFHDAVRSRTLLWASTPYDVTPTAFKWLGQHNVLDRLVVSPWPSALRKLASSYLSPQDLSDLFSIAPDREGLSGLPIFDTLLTGTKIAIMVEMAGADHISLFGCDLFRSAKSELWGGHNTVVDLKALLAVRRRLLQVRRSFYWHEMPRSLPFLVWHHKNQLKRILFSDKRPTSQSSPRS